MGSEESYKTNWFAFSAMHRFLAPIYECSSTMNTEEPVENSYFADEYTSGSRKSQSLDFASKKRRQQGSIEDILQAKKLMDEAFSFIIEERAAAAKAIKPEKVDECDLYAQLLAEKLKKIDEDRRIILMHNIDMLVFQEIVPVKEERAESEDT
ncbi:uncharacterized protein LOC121734702 [Aricia agestis]|uniref:uncharacterized protein LOC121734702 n=1 Tax=Aricia agestis TaxID=91739 RepID=UPI001C208A17|nr:uncharacterized protein LOC121734702 [Aricia agestis]